MFCRGCHHALDEGLVANSCPECGRPFDPDNPKTYLEPVAKSVDGERVVITPLDPAIEREAAKLCLLPIVLFVVAIVIMAIVILAVWP